MKFLIDHCPCEKGKCNKAVEDAVKAKGMECLYCLSPQCTAPVDRRQLKQTSGETEMITGAFSPTDAAGTVDTAEEFIKDVQAGELAGVGIPSNASMVIDTSGSVGENGTLVPITNSTGIAACGTCNLNDPTNACDGVSLDIDSNDGSSLGCGCVDCPSTKRHSARGLRQARPGAIQISVFNCGADTACCTRAYRRACPIQLVTCLCNDVVIPCPVCDNSKDSNKLLLLLLLLLLLIPCLICLLIVCCCMIRRKKTEADTLFTTFDPQADPIMTTCAPMGCTPMGPPFPDVMLTTACSAMH
jgi:hypothetical protein